MSPIRTPSWWRNWELARGACRVDVCVINGHLHGYEIKSDVDTLRRLPLQQQFYSDVLDKATIVVGQRHLDHALETLPAWWGSGWHHVECATQ